MDFVLIDDSIITAYTERVSRIVKGVGHLQDKMNEIYSNVFGDDQANVSQTASAEIMDYSEPVANVGYEDNMGQSNDVGYEGNMMDSFDMGYGETNTQYDEPVQPAEQMESNFDQSFNQSFDEPVQVSSQSPESDLDIDLDAMLEGISFDDADLQL